MKTLLTTISIAILLCCGAADATAQGIRGKADLKNFYKESFNNKPARDSLVKAYCTDSLYQAWKANGFDSTFFKVPRYVIDGREYNGVVKIIRWPNSNQYLMSFGYWKMDNWFEDCKSFAVHVKDGKIYNVDRPKLKLSTRHLIGTRWQLINDADTNSLNDYSYEFQAKEIVKHYDGDKQIAYPYYLTDTIPTEFDFKKVGSLTKGRYLVRYNTKLKRFYCNSFFYFSRERGCMAVEYPKGGVNVYVNTDKYDRAHPLKSIYFPVSGPAWTVW